MVPPGCALESFVRKRIRNALMMSSAHYPASITDRHKKRTVIMYYDKHKGGVDTLHENFVKFDCWRKTNRWPMVINFNLTTLKF